MENIYCSPERKKSQRNNSVEGGSGFDHNNSQSASLLSSGDSSVQVVSPVVPTETFQGILDNVYTHIDKCTLQWENISLHLKSDRVAFPHEAFSNKGSGRIEVHDSEFLLEQRSLSFTETIAPFNPDALRHVKHKLTPKDQFLVSNSSGIVRPGEMVAIMGPSGSGKTSLLNLIAQRRLFSKKECDQKGEVYINQRQLQPRDFAKVGAFVQQDDMLISTLTPKELLTFAANIKTKLTREQIATQVKNVIRRLNLGQCQDQLIGGYLVRGVSGGERKRTSIGYELITNPAILLMDEPTSGLDSSTSLRIVKDLKKEANKGMAIMATIHQPSAEIFFIFDRIILLAEGRTIFQESPWHVLQYFEKFGLEAPKYSNPADILSKIGADPSVCLASGITVEYLALQYQKSEYIHSINCKEQNGKYGDSRPVLRLSQTVREKQVTQWHQYQILLGRTLRQLWRSPISISSGIFMSLFMLFLNGVTFHGMASQEWSAQLSLSQNREIMKGQLGLVFMTTVNQFMIPNYCQIQQIPHARPVLIREKQNRMYALTPYYLSGYTVSLLATLPVPLIIGVGTYYAYDFPEKTLATLLVYLGNLLLVSVAGSSFGFMLGCFMESELSAGILSQLAMILFNQGSGCFANIGAGANAMNRFLSLVSPIRYGCEIMLRNMLKYQEQESEFMLEFIGYTHGSALCYSVLVGFIVLFFVLGIIGLHIKYSGL